MKRNLLSLTLSLLLIFSCAVSPALADEIEDTEEIQIEEITEEAVLEPELTDDELLTSVILSVKSQLHIGDSYTTFTSDCEDYGLLRYYNLYWEDEDGNSVNVTAGGTGTIYWAYFNYADTGSSYSSSDYAPSFPTVTSEQLQSIAAAFLAPLFEDPISVQLDPVTLSTAGTQTAATVSGTVLFNGLPSEITLSVRINLETLQITRYIRSDAWDGYYSDEIPSGEPAVTKEEAAALLNTVWDLTLQYVQLDDGSITLHYVPGIDSAWWYVDAQSGDLIDLAEVYAGLDSTASGRADEAAIAEEAEMDTALSTASASSASLTYVEGQTVEQLAGTLSVSELESLLRAYDALGLEDMRLAGSSYSMTTEGDITCQLTWTRALTADEIRESYGEEYIAALIASDSAYITKRITVDAYSGQLLQVSTTDYMARENFTGDEAAVVADFLETLYPEEFAVSTASEDGTRYVRTVNGILYPENYMRATVCSLDGSIRTFYYEWDEDAVFPSPDGIVTQEAAENAYAAALDTVLQYMAYPELADTSTAAGLAYATNLGDCTYRWILVWKTENMWSIDEIDAFTGTVLYYDDTGTETAESYTDLDSSWAAEQIETLAAYGIGFGSSDTFRPAAELTQRDMLILLLNAVGNSFDADSLDEDTEDWLYEAAYDYGMLTKAERDPDSTVTRMEFLQTLIRASVYGPAAELTGIYQCSFADAAELTEAELGYAAIAEALGLVSGDENRNLNPDRNITRQEAAVILYNFMAA